MKTPSIFLDCDDHTCVKLSHASQGLPNRGIPQKISAFRIEIVYWI
jgi:hypothetical protein